VLLAAAGLASAVITIFAKTPTLWVPGLIFGAALAAYFAAYEGHRNPIRIAAFVFACVVSYVASVFSAFGSMWVFHSGASTISQGIGVPLPAFFVGGLVGAFPVLAAGMFLFGPRNMNWASIGRTFLWSVGGGLFGALGGRVAGIVTHGIYSDMSALYIIWQPSVGLMLGLLLVQERRRLAVSLMRTPMNDVPDVQRNRGILIAAGVGVTCLLGFLSFIIFRSVRAHLSESRRAAAYRRLVAEAPSSIGLSPVNPLTAQQVFIVHEVAGLYPWVPPSWVPESRPSVPVITSSPLAQEYSMGYTRTNDAPQSPFPVLISVTQLPNADWARYSAKFEQWSVASDCPRCVTMVTKFGQHIIQISPQSGRLEFLWTSGSFCVSLSYETRPIGEAFLEEYLRKYPNSAY
jgi:hypothetical protein